MKKTIVHFIRLGQTLYNLENRIQGSVDIQLSFEGRNQANSISNDMFLENYDVAYHSSLSRSKETLDIILEKIKKSPRIKLSDLIIERSYGCFEGMREEEIESKYPELCQTWKNNENVFIEGAELIENIVLRLNIFINQVIDYEKVLAVTHSGVLFALYKFITNTNLGERPKEISFPNCCSVYLNIYHKENRFERLELNIEDKTYVYSCSPTEMIVSAS